MKLHTKLIGGFLIVAAVTLFVGALGYFNVKKLGSALYEVGAIRLPSIQGLALINEAQTCVDSAENALLCEDLDEQARKEQYQRIAEAWKRVDEGLKTYEPLPQTTEEEKTWKEFVPAWQAWKKDHETYMQLCKEYDTKRSQKVAPVELTAHHKKMIEQSLVINPKSFALAESLLGKIVDINNTVAEEAKKESVSNRAQMVFVQNLVLVSVLVGVAGAVALGFFLSFSIGNPIKRMANQLAEGADQTAAASSQVSSASQSLAQGASEQAASLEETSSSLEEMSSMTKRNVENAQQAKDLATEARKAGDTGAQDMRDMVTAMDSIKASSAETSKIIKTIDEIAFQTNILALNAAVEAARAGEAGAGFAVVADEVRNLAQRSATAAKETSEKIAQALERSERGVQISQKVAKSLEEIIAKARQVDELTSEVAAASKEQSQGIEQINTAVTQMDKVTQSNAANAEETASSSEELSAQAVEMKHAVNDLLALVQGKGAVNGNGGAPVNSPCKPTNGNGARKLHATTTAPVQEPAPADAVAPVNRLAAGKPMLAQSTARAAVKGKHGGNGNGKQLEEAIPMDKDFKDF
jgi:methyl-accepting chemotaxis protein